MDNIEDARPPSVFARIYDKVVLSQPWATMAIVIGIAVFFAYYIREFKMDASSDSIVLENDDALRYYDESRKVYRSDDYVVVTYTPPEGILSDKSLETIKQMSDEFSQVPHVIGVTSILTVPLFHSPDVGIFGAMQGKYKMLGNPEAQPDKTMAFDELTSSPLYSNYLVSKDGKTTAIQITFETDKELQDLTDQRYELREKKREGTLTPEEAVRLEEVEQLRKARYLLVADARRAEIDQVREIIKKYNENGDMYLGGVPMIVADIVEYVEKDIRNFGIAVLAFIVLMLAFIFKSLRFMILPFMTCLMTVVIMMGYLGYTDWHTTIVTSNFTSLLLIMTTENAIHVAQRWRELHAQGPDRINRDLVLTATRQMAMPCFFSLFTTMAGFASLIVSNIRPIMDFGIMMTLGLAVSYVVTFLFIPAGMLLFKKGKAIPLAKSEEERSAVVSVFARITERHRWLVALAALGLFALGGIGITKLTVENRFIDYFRESSMIYQGMTEIDERLGGTTPLEVVIEGDGTKDYWLDVANLKTLGEVHNWLDEQKETGKVISLYTMLVMLDRINGPQPVTTQFLKLARTQVPQDLQAEIVSPYTNSDFTETRITMRVMESDKTLQRKELLSRIENYLVDEAGFEQDKVHVTGMFVLYNNMLQSLFGSQIKTVFTVFLTVFIVFSIVFRSFILALIGLVPNILSVTVILGTIGWLGIPLDMMTIMIAAITFGLADDFTIHYIHRFQEEFPKDRNYKATMFRCHNSIGRALSYSMVAIVAGFAVLTMSNFKPTVYFGVFTGLAIFLALLASHTILPMLIITLKPLGPDRAKIEGGENTEAHAA